MLHITVTVVPELWDEKKEEFIPPVRQTLQLEHSLVALSKWESRWQKPFFTKAEKTSEEILDYIKCMTITPGVDPSVYTKLSDSNISAIQTYINAPMTATTFSKNAQGKPSREIVTAEVIYHWMIALQIPAEYEKWHLNKLITLIRVCSIKNSPPKKMSKRETLAHNAAVNAARMKKYNTKG